MLLLFRTEPARALEKRRMLLVRTRLGQSPIHGLGLFAVNPIPAGAVVSRFTPGFDRIWSRRRSPHSRSRSGTPCCGWVDPRLDRFLLCCNDARFMNHSDTPNVRPRFEDDSRGEDVAPRDIAAGEELTIDYRIVEGVRPASPGGAPASAWSR